MYISLITRTFFISLNLIFYSWLIRALIFSETFYFHSRFFFISNPKFVLMKDIHILRISCACSDRIASSTIYTTGATAADLARAWVRMVLERSDNIAARGSESDTVNPLTRLLRVLLLEPSRIIVATLPGSPWHSYHQKYRVGKSARATHSRLIRSLEISWEVLLLLRKTSKSYLFFREIILSRIRVQYAWKLVC